MHCTQSFKIRSIFTLCGVCHAHTTGIQGAYDVIPSHKPLRLHCSNKIRIFVFLFKQFWFSIMRLDSYFIRLLLLFPSASPLNLWFRFRSSLIPLFYIYFFLFVEHCCCTKVKQVWIDFPHQWKRFRAVNGPNQTIQLMRHHVCYGIISFCFFLVN